MVPGPPGGEGAGGNLGERWQEAPWQAASASVHIRPSTDHRLGGHNSLVFNSLPSELCSSRRPRPDRDPEASSGSPWLY